MYELIPRIITYIFTLIIYLFIMRIVKMIYTDIKTMQRKKGAVGRAYLKLLNIRQELNFDISESYAISEDIIIGRSRKCDLSLDDSFLSDKHAKVLVAEDCFYLEDLDSTNGTYLNNEQVTGDPIELRNGDNISMGRVKWIFVTAESE